MNKAIRLQQTMQWMDFVPLTICLYIYRVCNNKQFEGCSGSDFVNFLNLKPTAFPIRVRPNQKLRVCYMILAISEKLETREVADDWINSMLKQCKIPAAYLKAHRSDFKNISAKSTKKYCDLIDEALEDARDI